jgi:hypothetical protein
MTRNPGPSSPAANRQRERESKKRKSVAVATPPDQQDRQRGGSDRTPCSSPFCADSRSS